MHGDDVTDERKAREALAEDLQEFVYGTITVLVVISALNGKQVPSARNAGVVVLGTALATWLAHAFSSIIGAHVREQRPTSRGEVALAFRRSWRVVTAALPATVLLVLAGRGWISVSTALYTATALAILALIGVAIVAARRSGFSATGTALYALVATSIGLCIAAIEVLIHH
jgi:hypothetical protein